MEKETCGDCRYYFEQANFCRLFAWECIEEDRSCCEDFSPVTNGDRIRQMSNEELVKILGCARHLETCIHMDDDYPCEKCSLDWLNAPAESEVNNG